MNPEQPIPPGPNLFPGILAAAAGLFGLFGYLGMRHIETREERAERALAVQNAFFGWDAFWRAIGDGNFSMAQDLHAFAEVNCDDAFRTLPGARLELFAPRGVPTDSQGRWVLYDDETKKKAAATLFDYLRRLVKHPIGMFDALRTIDKIREHVAQTVNAGEPATVLNVLQEVEAKLFAEAGADAAGDQLLAAYHLLKDHAGERGFAEDELSTLKRIIRERDEAIASNRTDEQPK